MASLKIVPSTIAQSHVVSTYSTLHPVFGQTICSVMGLSRQYNPLQQAITAKLATKHVWVGGSDKVGDGNQAGARVTSQSTFGSTATRRFTQPYLENPIRKRRNVGDRRVYGWWSGFGKCIGRQRDYGKERHMTFGGALLVGNYLKQPLKC
nr:hypothetical protein L204_06429 [Cryptococcus depauperatus CBS 7855]